MSIDISWDTLTGGPDGAALAESIRAFVHDRFQTVPLPRMIRSVNVHTFEFGSVAPRVELQDVTDPWGEFYEDDDDDDDAEVADGGREGKAYADGAAEDASERGRHGPAEQLTPQPGARLDSDPQRHAGISEARQHEDHHRTTSPSRRARQPRTHLPPLDVNPSQRTTTPGFAGSMSNLGYFHLPLSAGLSGTSTPLAAVAGGARFPGWTDHRQEGTGPYALHHHHRASSYGSVTPPSTLAATSRPASRHTGLSSPRPSSSNSAQHNTPASHSKNAHTRQHHSSRSRSSSPPSSPHTHHKPASQHIPSPSDLQVLARVSYDGDVRMTLTAEILLDYPMPSFVGIPLKLTLTGMTFHGTGVLAHVRHPRSGTARAHFCFLAPEDAEHDDNGGVAVDGKGPGGDGGNASGNGSRGGSHCAGGGGGGGAAKRLIEAIRVESEIGQREGGRQVLKNVGRVEKFILEQVQRIFEDEFVWPSFWTFLV